MQNANAYVATEEREQSPNDGKAAQQLEHILASGLPPLYRRAYRILGNAADAEEAVQDALLAAYTHLHQFRGQAQVSIWLTTIMLNCARLQLRRRGKHVQVSLDESNAEGGAKSYIARGKMVGGFAFVAYPAVYRASGVVTLIVNHNGIVYQTDLGPDTEKISSAMTEYDPDSSWQRVG